jgi:hypothetical protein
MVRANRPYGRVAGDKVYFFISKIKLEQQYKIKIKITCCI